MYEQMNAAVAFLQNEKPILGLGIGSPYLRFCNNTNHLLFPFLGQNKSLVL